MNWRLVIQLSLFGLAMGLATVFFISSRVEPLLWLIVLAISAYIIANRATGKLFLHGLAVGVANSVWVTASHMLLFDRYMANHAQEAAMMASSQAPVSPRVMMAIVGPVIGVLSGLLLGALAIVAAKLFPSKIARVAGLLLIVSATTLGAQAEPRRCKAAEWPKKLPTPDAVVDSGALRVAAAGLSAMDGALFSVVYRQDGPREVRWLQPEVPPPGGDAVLQILQQGLRPVEAPRPLGAVRLRFQGRPATATVERAIYCPPEAPPGESFVPPSILGGASTGDRAPAAGRKVRMDAEMTLDEGGHITKVQMISGSGIREVDDAFVTALWNRKYLPALIDGLPIQSWVRYAGSHMKL